MKALAIVSHKGGAGKTSSAVMLAEEFSRRGLRVVLVDADRQGGAGLLLGLEQATGTVQQTRNPRLRYLCSSTLPLRELPARARELQGLFDLAVIDTPSLDDPLARGWLQLCTDVLFVIPVEPISIRTLQSADTAIAAIHRLNPEVRVVGTLPTLFDEQDPAQRTLMMELMSRCTNGLLSPAIPLDPGLAHRAEQRLDRRTEASEACRKAYDAVAGDLARELGFEAAAVAGPRQVAAAGWAPSSRGSTPSTPAEAVPAPPTLPAPVRPAGRPALMRWSLAALVALILLALGLTLTRRPESATRAGGSGAATKAVRAAR